MIHAILQTYSPNYEKYFEIFETNKIPLKSGIPKMQCVNGALIEAYTLRFNDLNTRQRLNLAEYCAREFNLTLTEAHARLSLHGFPINCLDVALQIPLYEEKGASA